MLFVARTIVSADDEGMDHDEQAMMCTVEDAGQSKEDDRWGEIAAALGERAVELRALDEGELDVVDEGWMALMTCRTSPCTRLARRCSLG